MTKQKRNKQTKLDELWLAISGYDDVAAFERDTGHTSAYMGDGLWVAPCGETDDDPVICACRLCTQIAE